MKKLLLAALVWGVAVHGAFAQSPQKSGQFDVVITLNSGCAITTLNNVTFTYTGMQNTPATSGGGAFSIKCTNLFGYGLGLQAGTAAPTTTGASSIGPITDSVVALAYTLSITTTSATGNGLDQNYTIDGTMAADQPGKCAAASCTNAGATNRTHTLIVSY